MVRYFGGRDVYKFFCTFFFKFLIHTVQRKALCPLTSLAAYGSYYAYGIWLNHVLCCCLWNWKIMEENT